MSDPIKSIDDEIKTLRDDEIPEIDIEMAIQRKYPEHEHDVVPHDGEPGIKRGQKARRCMDTQGNYGMPCPHPATRECFHHKVKKGQIFPICGHHAYIAGIQQHVEPVQHIYNCNECQLAITFGEDKDMYGGGTNMDMFPKTGIVVKEKGKWKVKTEDGSRTLGTHDNAQDAHKQLYAIEMSKKRRHKGGLTVMQAIKLDKLAEADWITKQRLEEAREKLRQQKSAPPPSAPKQEAPMKNNFDIADDLFYKEFHGAATSGDAGMRYGYERIPVMIYSKLMRPGVETKRRGLKWDTLTPQEFEIALSSMMEAAEAARKRALAHMRQRSDGPVNRKKP